MAVKTENKRVPITMTPSDIERLDFLLSLKNSNRWWDLYSKTDLVTTLIREEYLRQTRKNENLG